MPLEETESLEMFEMVREKTQLLERATFDVVWHSYFPENTTDIALVAFNYYWQKSAQTDVADISEKIVSLLYKKKYFLIWVQFGIPIWIYEFV